MNIAQLEYLKELYGCGSFSIAAKRLGITQPALSLQIQKLENELDVKLLDRSKRPIKFTEEGQVFYDKSIDILKQLEQLKQISAELSEEVRGNLKIGIIPTLAPYLLPLFIHQLNADYPALHIEVSELKTEEIIAKIKIGDFDCGIISTPVSFKNLSFLPLFYERFYIYISESHSLFKKDKVDINEIKQEDIWYLDEGNCFQNQVDSICRINQQQKITKNLVFHSNSIESLRRIVENRNGITFLPELATINIPAEQEEMIKEFSSNQPFREISFVSSKRYTKERQVSALHKIIRDSIPQRMLTKPKSWIVDTML